MKILVLQLARYGDIYLSWPALRALRRRFPEAEIHFLVRKRFAAAAKGLSDINEVKIVDPSEVLANCLEGHVHIQSALGVLYERIEEIRSEKYDWVANLTFSPVSSFLTHLVADKYRSVVRGLTRHQDGFLAIPDDESAFVHAQAGTSRVHLSEAFAGILGLSLIPEDWKFPQVCLTKPPYIHGNQYVVIHVGASEVTKQVEPALLGLLGRRSSRPIVLIGSSEEAAVGMQVESLIPKKRVMNLVGQTSIESLFGILRHSAALVGADSAPVHMAALVGTPVLNLANGSVNFWETGPRSPGSAVVDLRETGPDLELISSSLEEVVNREPKPKKHVYCSRFDTPAFVGTGEISMGWNLQRYIYLGGDYPVAPNTKIYEVLEKIFEVNEVAISTLKKVSTKEQKLELGILDRCDELLQAIVKVEPEITPLVKWYFTEKIRIGPGAFSEVREDSLKIHENFQDLVWGILHKGESNAV